MTSIIPMGILRIFLVILEIFDLDYLFMPWHPQRAVINGKKTDTVPIHCAGAPFSVSYTTERVYYLKATILNECAIAIPVPKETYECMREGDTYPVDVQCSRFSHTRARLRFGKKSRHDPEFESHS